MVQWNGNDDNGSSFLDHLKVGFWVVLCIAVLAAVLLILRAILT